MGHWCFLNGHDKHKNQCIIIYPRYYKPGFITVDEYLRYVVYQMERAIEAS